MERVKPEPAIAKSPSGITKGAARSALIVLSAAYGIKALDSALLGLLEEPIKAEFGVTDAQMGLLTGSAFALFYIALGIPLSRLADRGNRTYLVAASLAFFSVATLASGFAWGFVSLLIARIFVAIGEAAPTPASTSILADYFPPERRQFPMVIFTIGGFLGGTLGMLGIGLLGVTSDWRQIFIVTAVPGLVLAPMVLAFVREPPRKPTTAATASSSTAIRDLLRIRSFRTMTLGFAMAMLVAYASLNWMPAFLSRSFGFDQRQIFLFVGLAWGGGGALGALLSGVLAARLRLSGPDRPLALLAAISAIFTAAFCTSFLVQDTGLALSALVLGLILVGGCQGPVFALVQDLVPSNRRATAIGLLLLLITAVGLGLGPLAVGILSDALRPIYGPDSVRYALVAVISVTGIISAVAFLFGSKSIIDDIAAFGDPPVSTALSQEASPLD
jgi:MFS family permease